MVPVKLTNVIVMDLSTSLALMTGAVAPMAEEPQTAFPEAINRRKSSVNPNFLVKIFVAKSKQRNGVKLKRNL